MFKFTGMNMIFTSNEKKKIKDLCQFIADKFLSKRRQKAMEVHIKFDRNLFNAENIYGDCIWEDQHYKPREFTVRVDADQKFNMILNTIAHELVHVKQWANGEMFELQRQRKCYKFKGDIIDTNEVEYWDFPWEIEAHGRTIGLVVQWCTARDFHADESNDMVVSG